MMNKIFLLMALPLLLAACSTTLTEDIETPAEPEEEQQMVGSIVTTPEFNYVQTLPGSRSTFVYDYEKRVMRSSFVVGDKLGIFAYGLPNNKEQEADIVPQSDLAGHFQTPEEFPLELNKQYVAYMPFIPGDFDSNSIPVTFKGQRQANNNKMFYYPNFSGNNKSGYEALYYESEKDASQHLEKLDYRGTMPTKPNAFNHVYMSMIRLGAVGRFYLKCPGEFFFDQLQFVADKECFTEDGYIVLGPTPYIKPTNMTHIMALDLGTDPYDPAIQNHAGWDMYKSADNKSYYNDVGYMICYIMMAPVDLSKRTLTLFLIAHEKESPYTKHYFKASIKNTQRPNLRADDFYQWTLVPDQDKPITFEEVTVQEWATGTAFTNGDTGTEGW